jgi:hypothetical protein
MRHQQKKLFNNQQKLFFRAYSLSARTMVHQIKHYSIVAFLLLLGLSAQAQTATWNPTGTVTGGFYQNPTEKSWFNPANWTWSGTVPTPAVPDANTDVVIPSGTAICWIPEDHTTLTAPNVNTVSPLCKSLLIDGGALYNQGSRNTGSTASKGLTVSGNMTLVNSGVYIGDAEIARIDGNISVDGSSYMVMDGGLNVIELKGDYTNSGTLGKVNPKSDALTVDFRGATTSTITIDPKS